MCIYLRGVNFTKPYIPSNRYRFKALNFRDNEITSLYVGSFQWKLGEWTISQGPVSSRGSKCMHSYSNKSKDHGFHTFIHKAPTFRLAKEESSYGVVGVFSVKDIIASGTFNSTKCETWKSAKLVAIYSRGGRLIKSVKNYKGPKHINL